MYKFKLTNEVKNIWVRPHILCYEDKQLKILFFKKKFGLYKNVNYEGRFLKNKLVNFINIYKNINTFDTTNSINTRRNKVMFYKKYNKLFFREGRRILKEYVLRKNYTTQIYLKKKIKHIIKKNWFNLIYKKKIYQLLLNCNIFFTFYDAQQFIEQFGIILDNKLVNNADIIITQTNIFSILLSQNIINFLYRKKYIIQNNFKKIKIYKFRIKQLINVKKSRWISFKSWININVPFYVSKDNTVEFDFRIGTGVILYDTTNINYITLYDKININLYMSRLYNWKYIT